MPERIVVCFRSGAALERPDSEAPPSPRPALAGDVFDTTSRPLGSDTASDRARPNEGEGYLARALALKKRAEALGATLCAWSAHTFAFDLAPEDIEESVQLASLASEETGVAAGARFSVGITQGEITSIGEAGRLAVLSWGQPLLAAVMLARIAPPGEVLLDPALPAVRSGELMIAGTYRGVDGSRRVRGLRLDAQQPLRRQVSESVARLCVPPLLGRAGELEQLAVPPGRLAIVRAGPGAGGTRLLAELLTHLAPSRGLFVAPVGASREPLGALRRSLARDKALSRARAVPGRPADLPALHEHLQTALARLLSGEGVAPRTAAELIDAWLAPAHGRFGLIVIDDAADVDPATLEAIASAMSRRGVIRAVARLGHAEALPLPLTSLTAASTVTLGPLAAHEAQELVRRLLDGCIAEPGARRWAVRGRGFPLAVRESLCEALENGALRWAGPTVAPRRRSAVRGEAARTMSEAQLAAPPALRPIEGRVRLLSTGPRTLLTALAVLGGDASDAAIDALCSGTGAPKVAALEDMLTGGGWTYRPEPGWLRLSSRTLRDVLIETIPVEQRPAWHLATAHVLQELGGALGLADAAWHAARGHDRRTAAELAAVAARVAGDAQLETSAAELLAFADEQEAVSELPEAGVDESESAPPPTYRMPIEVVGDVHELRRGGEGGERADVQVVAAPPWGAHVAAFAPGATVSVTEARPRDDAAPASPEGASAEHPELPDMGEELPVRGSGGDPLAKTSESPVLAIGDIAVRLAELAKQALIEGDLRTLERLVGELRRAGGHSELVERMGGIISLSRGSKDEALRRLRVAAAAPLPPAQRARALLAYGVALAAVGRAEGALLEVLSALARAREAADRHGEQACARFLSRLSAAAGHEGAARAWAAVARRASAGPAAAQAD